MKHLLAITFLLFSTVMFANGDPAVNTIVIKGKVVDASDGQSLSGVKVFSEGSDVTVFTDRDGYFEIPVSQSISKLQFSLVSFSSTAVPVSSSLSGGDVIVELSER